MMIEKCNNCRWYCKEEYVCVNADSEHCADFIMPDDICMEWENMENET